MGVINKNEIISTKYSRRKWLKQIPAAAALIYSVPILAKNKFLTQNNTSKIYKEFPANNPELVKEFVGVCHNNFERAKELLTKTPTLVKASWDWGFGDWETGLGAASHVGRRDIAQLLIENGARPDIFTYAMLGHLEVVKTYIKTMPGIQKIHGPHGITLLAHAENGGDEALSVVEYLKTLGDADIKQTSLNISENEKQMLVGTYKFGENADDFFEIKLHRLGWPMLERKGKSANRMHLIGKNEFATAGSPYIKIKFNFDGENPLSFTITDGDLTLTANKI